ncbi:MAG: DMT family transporter [Acidimicrobiales bacterium]
MDTDERQRSNRIAWLVASVVVLGWGINFVLAKHALNQFSIGTFNFVRFAGMVALGWATIAITGQRTPIARQDRTWLALVAIVGFCGYVFGFSVGLSYTSAFSASLLLALVPLWVAIFTSVLARKLPPASSLLALGLAAGGTALFVGTRTSVSLGWGDLIALVVAALYASYLLLNRRLVNRYAPFTLTTYAATLAAVPILALTAPSLPRQDWAAVSIGGWLAMAWVITGPVFVAWSLWNWVLRHLTPVQVAPLLFTVPVTSGLAAWIFLDEQIAAGQILGTAAVIAGLVLNQRSPTDQPPQDAPQPPTRRAAAHRLNARKGTEARHA